MKRELPAHGIRCVELPRYESGGSVVSASTVREAIAENNFKVLEEMLPETTLAYLKSPEAEPVLAKIRREAKR